jgi:DNA-directed RNA polymerase specialized sigma subunit
MRDKRYKIKSGFIAKTLGITTQKVAYLRRHKYKMPDFDTIREYYDWYVDVYSTPVKNSVTTINSVNLNKPSDEPAAHTIQNKEILSEIFSKLTEKEISILKMRYYHDMSDRRIAKELGVAGISHERVFKIIQKIRRMRLTKNQITSDEMWRGYDHIINGKVSSTRGDYKLIQVLN